MAILVILVAILFITSRNRKKHNHAKQQIRKRSKTAAENEVAELLAQGEARKNLDEKYKKVLSAHNRNEEKIGTMYAVAKELTLPNSPQMQKVIDLCLEDIELAPMVIEYQKAFDNMYEMCDGNGYYFSTFKRLAIIFEKQERYEEAISVCQKAISLGATKDGTESGMIGRMARLTRKQNTKRNKIES